MPAASLSDLQHQITAREHELQALRQELESQQEHLIELTRRKEELQLQLQQVEEEITTLAATSSTATKPSRPAASAPAESSKNPLRVGELILSILRDVGGPMTARQMSVEAQKRGYLLQNRDPVNAVKNRLQDLKSRGVVRRASGQQGYVLVSSAGGANPGKGKKRKSANTVPVPKHSNGEASSSSESTRTAKPESQGEPLPLRELLTDILKNSRKPLSARELSEQILASGYQTNSENFVKVIGTMLWKMENVERVTGKGYRIKPKI